MDKNNRVNRELCWSKRDLYFECLDKNGIVDPSKDTKKTCNQEKKQFHGNCLETWFNYFNEKRVADLRKQQILKSPEQN